LIAYNQFSFPKTFVEDVKVTLSSNSKIQRIVQPPSKEPIEQSMSPIESSKY